MKNFGSITAQEKAAEAAFEGFEYSIVKYEEKLFDYLEFSAIHNVPISVPQLKHIETPEKAVQWYRDFVVGNGKVRQLFSQKIINL